MHQWFQQYVGLETETSVLRTYQAEFVPGLLQTEDYQRALLANDIKPWSADEVDRLVALRAGRQEILAGDDPGAGHDDRRGDRRAAAAHQGGAR